MEFELHYALKFLKVRLLKEGWIVIGMNATRKLYTYFILAVWYQTVMVHIGPHLLHRIFSSLYHPVAIMKLGQTYVCKIKQLLLNDFRSALHRPPPNRFGRC